MGLRARFDRVEDDVHDTLETVRDSFTGGVTFEVRCNSEIVRAIEGLAAASSISQITRGVLDLLSICKDPTTGDFVLPLTVKMVPNNGDN